jgi:hypothetical protein
MIFFYTKSKTYCLHLLRIFQEVGWEEMEWIDLAQDRDRRRAVANGGMNLRVP